MTLSTHSGRLERWLGRENCEAISLAMKDWYGPPIAVDGVPGHVMLHAGGNFTGEIRDGWEMSYLDRGEDLLKRLKRASRVASARSRNRLNAGFASLSDLISEATAGGKRQEVFYSKTGPLSAVGASSTLWLGAGQPVAGAIGSAAPGGRVLTSATTGALQFHNAVTGGDTQHIVSTQCLASITAMQLLLYDRLFDVAKTMNSTATEAVTGVPTRYTNTVAGSADYIGGNFLTMEIHTALPATAHNWTVCTYTDHTGAAQTLPSVAGVSGGIASRLDLPQTTFFAPLASGSQGIKALTQMQCSALVATGTVNFVIGHPLAWQPCPVANFICVVDGINTAFNLVRVFDNACLSHLDVTKSAGSQTNYTGSITMVAG